MSESVLKIQKLQGSFNWELWAIRMEAVLTKKGYYNVITPTNYMETNDYSSEQQAAYIERQSRGKKAIIYIRLALSDGPLL
jgi:hypothetical protein